MKSVVIVLQWAIILVMLFLLLRKESTHEKDQPIDSKYEKIELDKEYVYWTYIKTKHDQVKLYNRFDSLGVDPHDPKYVDLIAYGGVFILKDFLEEVTPYKEEDYLKEYRQFLKDAASTKR